MTPNSGDNHEKESTANNNRNVSSFVHQQSQVRTPPPPGFPIDKKATFYGSNRAGAGSAPPLLLTSDLITNANSFTSSLDDLSGPENLRMMLKPTNHDDSQVFTNVNKSAQGGRTSSYVNLAAALGEGLAESMGDSLEELGTNVSTTIIEEPESGSIGIDFDNTNNAKKMDFNVDMGIDNYSRQSRHSLTRLVGSSNNGFPLDSRNFLQQKITEEYRNGTGDLTTLRTLQETSGGSTTANKQNTQPNALTEDLTKNMDLLKINTSIGRASAPPQFYDKNFSQFGLGTNSHALQRQADITKREDPTPSPAPTSIDFSNTISSPSIQRSDTATPSLRNESESMVQLRPFIWNSSCSNSRDLPHQPSRALAIFGVSQLPISEIRSTCEAFGSLLYFRSEFCASRNVIFTAYHDLRSACHASKELKNYLQRMASSSLDDSDVVKCEDALHVMFSVSLLSSSERDESSLLFSNLPFGVDKEQVYQIMASFGAILSISEHANDGEVSSSDSSYLVKFYDVQDANHCILEIQSTKPWGQTVSIKTQKRAENDRKRGQDLLSLISKWRMTANSSQQRHVTNNMSQAQTYSPKTVSSQKSNSNVSTSSTQSTTPPLSFLPPAPQLVVGPDGQYSYVVLQPQGYQASQPQFIQPGTVVSSHVTHQPPHPIPQAQYVFDGQNYWLQHPSAAPPPPPPREHHITNNHVPGFHHIQQNQTVAYQVLPAYPNAPNQNIHGDANVPGRNGHSHNFGANGIKAGGRDNGNSESNQRNVLDIEAVKQGWDIRTSLMIRNIPNKYTRSMLLSEFKESNHGPGKIDFFYLPIDFRNKCNRGYAFVNFVNYRDIVTFYDAYNGKGWKTFKSDKICEITYARIQGKSSMMKRFQNSALMDKDPEYRPVVFNANGEVCSPIGEP